MKPEEVMQLVAERGLLRWMSHFRGFAKWRGGIAKKSGSELAIQSECFSVGVGELRVCVEGGRGSKLGCFRLFDILSRNNVAK